MAWVSSWLANRGWLGGPSNSVMIKYAPLRAIGTWGAPLFVSQYGGRFLVGFCGLAIAVDHLEAREWLSPQFGLTGRSPPNRAGVGQRRQLNLPLRTALRPAPACHVELRTSLSSAFDSSTLLVLVFTRSTGLTAKKPLS